MRPSLMALSALPVLLAIACTEPPSDDADGDGVPAARDCDDTNPRIGEPAPEVCNGLDDDCNGTPDDVATDATDWYRDSDGDGYGSAAGPPVRLCEAPDTTGWTTDNQDCDDAFDSVFPGADERCDGLDNDCDTAVDEDPIDPATFYRDADGDGWGNPDETLLACAPDDGYAPRPGDCDDNEPQVHTTADELCNERDDDCDEMVDEDAVDAPSWYRDGDLDGHAADGAEEVRSCEPPEGFAASTGDCDDTEPRRNPSAVEVCDGLDNDCSPGTTEDGMVSIDGLAASDLADAFSKATAGSRIGLCEGVWAADVSLSSSVTITGYGDTDSIVWTTAGGGSMLSFSSRVDLVVSGISFVDGSATSGGAIDASDAASLTVKECVFEGNSAVDGGAIYADGSIPVQISDTTFTDNTASGDGGAIYAGESVLQRVTFETNSADRGGAFAVSGGDVALDTDTVFDTNSATDVGGALAILDSSQVVDGTFENNESSSSGGAAWLADGATLSLAVLEDNSADESGGAIACAGACTLESITVSENLSTDGAGIALLGSGTVSITGATVEGNVALDNGGGLLVEGAAEVTIDGGSIIDNAADAGGGAFISAGTLESISVDWGSAATDNDPDDIDVNGSTYDAYGSGASFECDAEEATCS